MKINRNKCSQCGACISACPVNAIKNFRINNSICIDCGACVSVCPSNAIS
jgi:ferredoxin